MNIENRSRKQIGSNFEDYTAEWLIANGYKILKRNYSAGHKEIDIIALKKNTICFIEVKSEQITEDNANRDEPPSKITYRKILNIISGVQAYVYELRKNDIDPYEFDYRFDGVSILFDNEYNVCEFKYFEGLYTVDEKSFF